MAVERENDGAAAARLLSLFVGVHPSPNSQKNINLAENEILRDYVIVYV